MLVTAILPCHNHGRWVQDAINSIVNQTRQPDTICIINNGSTDNSKDKILSKLTQTQKPILDSVIQEYYGQIDNIPTVFLHTNTALGPAKARNLGIEICWNKTDIYALLDTDDIYLPAKIEKSLKIFEEHADFVGLVYSDYDTLNVQTGLQLREFKEPYSRIRLLQECIVNCDSLISKTALAKIQEKTGFFDESLRTVEDWDVWLRISEHMMMVHIPESLVLIRTGQHSSTASVPKEVWEANWRKVALKLQQRNAK